MNQYSIVGKNICTISLHQYFLTPLLESHGVLQSSVNWPANQRCGQHCGAQNKFRGEINEVTHNVKVRQVAKRNWKKVKRLAKCKYSTTCQQVELLGKNHDRADFHNSVFYDRIFAKSTKLRRGKGGIQWLAKCIYSRLKLAKTVKNGALKNLRGQSSMAEAHLSRFGRNPLWLTSTSEIKAAICLKRLNNVSHSVKHTSAALCIMHQRPPEGRAWKDNTTYPWGMGRGGGEEDGGGTERVSVKDLTRIHHPQRWIKGGEGGRGAGAGRIHSKRPPWGLFTQLPLICTWFFNGVTQRKRERGREREETLLRAPPWSVQADKLLPLAPGNCCTFVII